jgi:hypothetical protein
MELTPVDFKAVAAKGHYLYVYLRKDDLTPYYVGLSCTHRRPTDPDHCVDIPEDVCRIRVLRSGLTKKQAEAWEQFYIFWYGRKCEGGCLRNLRSGGSTGSTGYRHTEEAKAKFKQRVQSAEVNAKRSATQSNRPHTAAHAAKLAAANKANALTRQAKSSQMRRINTAKRMGVCPLIFGVADKKEHARIRARFYRGERDMLALQAA